MRGTLHRMVARIRGPRDSCWRCGAAGTGYRPCKCRSVAARSKRESDRFSPCGVGEGNYTNADSRGTQACQKLTELRWTTIAFDRHNPGEDHAGVERLRTRSRHVQKHQPARGRISARVQDRSMQNRLVGTRAPLSHQNQPPDGSRPLRRRYVTRLP